MSLFLASMEGSKVWRFHLKDGHGVERIERRQDSNIFSETQARLRWPFEALHPKACLCGCKGIKIVKVVEEV